MAGRTPTRCRITMRRPSHGSNPSVSLLFGIAAPRLLRLRERCESESDSPNTRWDVGGLRPAHNRDSSAPLTIRHDFLSDGLREADCSTHAMFETLRVLRRRAMSAPTSGV